MKTAKCMAPLALAFALQFGCSESSTQSPVVAPTNAQAAGTNTVDAPTDHEVCVEHLTRQRSCQSEYLPALVELRVSLDKPAGIAASDQSEGRAALIAAAEAEYVVDSTDQAIAASCDSIAESVPEEEWGALRAQVEDCSAAVSCADFVACSIELQRSHL